MRSNKTFLFLTDLILLNAALFGVFRLTMGGNPRVPLEEIYLIIFSNVAWIFLVLVTLPYHVNRTWQLSRLIKNQAAFLFVHLLVIASLTILYEVPINIVRLGVFYFAFIILFFGYRIVFLYLRRIFSAFDTKINYVLVGRNRQAQNIRKWYLTNPDLGYRFLGFIDSTRDNLPLHELRLFCENHEVHEIIWCEPPNDAGTLTQLVQFGLNSLIKVRLATDASDSEARFFPLQNQDSPARQVTAFAIDDGMNQILKRAFDLGFACTVFLLFFSWLFPVVALIIKLESKGPVFFVQQRNGIGNRPFGCYKFRSMIVNNEADSLQATKNDPRVTRFGNFLRKSSIDELPQFINVLSGEMSVIGPRPHPIKLNEKFEPYIANIMSRHYVKPGITGLAQCMGYRGETQTVQDMENRVRLDRYYIENWSFWLDIKIIFLTVVSLLRGSDKAY